MTAIDVAVPPIPEISGEISGGWLYALNRSQRNRHILYNCCIARRVLPFYESSTSNELPRLAIQATEDFARAKDLKERYAKNTVLYALQSEVSMLLTHSQYDELKPLDQSVLHCVNIVASYRCNGVAESALECLDVPARSKERFVHKDLTVWMLANPRLRPTEQSTGLARQILDERRWTVSMAGMLCDALIDAGLKDKHWLPHVLWHPDVVNLPVLGVTFLERLANPKPS